MKSISFLFGAFVAGLFFIACKDAKTNGTESTETAEVVISADSLQGLKTSLTETITTMQGLVASKKTEIEASIAATDNETAIQELNTFLEKVKGIETNLQDATTKVANATAETWTTVYDEVLPVLHDTKSLLTSGGMTTTPQAGTTTGEKK
jgi:hypothetical protein